MLKRLEIKKLFGRFNYDITLNNSGITIITGPNGYGKSTILNMINEFSNNNFSKLLNYNFYSLKLCFSDNSNLIIKKLQNTFKINDVELKYVEESLRVQRRRHYGLPPYIRPISSHELIDVRNNERILVDEDFLKRYNIIHGDEEISDPFLFDILINLKYYEKNKKLLEAFEKALNDIKKAKKQIGKVNFIKEQRLLEERQISEDRRSYDESKKEFIKVLKLSSNSLKQEMERVMSKHSILSNELDSTYIKRLFETNGKMSSEDFDKNLTSLKERQALLNKYELASIIRNTSNLKYVNEFEKDLYIFFDDNQKKYDIFEPLIQKITLYEQIINNKLTFKKLKISRSNGIQVVSDDNKDLELSKLSSGEQEILVLYYKLIFESDVDLLMIDEPEISLHIAWQKNILKDLKEIVKLNNKLNIIIATHSPQIISDNWDLQIDLGGQYNG